MEIFKQKFTKLQTEIINFLFLHAGKTYNQSELAKNLGVSSTAIAKSLDGLEEFLNIRKKFMYFIELDDNQKVIELKRVNNIKNIYTSGLSDFLSENFPGTKIILFGSYSYGEDKFDSDIDIALIGSGGKSVDLSEFENLLKRNVSLHFFRSIRKINEDLRNSIINGIVLKGFVEL